LSVIAVSPILRPDDGGGAEPMAGRRVTGGGRAMRSPLASWFPSGRARETFRRSALGRQSIVLPPRDRAWRGIAPDFAGSVQMAGTGLPFQIVAEREVDRSGDPRRLAAALAAGQTTYLPQVHQVLPRLTRLMVGLRSAFFTPVAGVAREECSFLFLVEGAGRAGMGLHHDGEVDAFWLQLEGRRTVTIGPRVRPGTPEELDEGLARRDRRAGWRTFDLEPGTLFHLPARTPHAVVCRGRSLAITLTWARGTRRARRARGRRPAPTVSLAWDVVSGFAEPIPPVHARTLWAQVPLVAHRLGRAPELRVWTPDGEGPRLPARAAAWSRELPAMPWLSRGLAARAGLEPLIAAGLLAPYDLPLRIRPADPAALDGWRFA
jgi:mannose-6-phosphate isomerase-like protein (cupin superfamily)